MDKKVIDDVRKYYQLPPQVSNEEISRDLKNSLGEVCIILDIAKKDFVKACCEAMPRVLKK